MENLELAKELNSRIQNIQLILVKLEHGDLNQNRANFLIQNELGGIQKIAEKLGMFYI